MDLLKELRKFSQDSAIERKKHEDFCHQSPYLRTKQEIVSSLTDGVQQRANILRTVSVFSQFSDDNLLAVAGCLDRLHFKKGAVVFQQGEIGDAFYVIEKGQVQITQKLNISDETEVPRLLTVLSNGGTFCDFALITVEPRAATVTVTSELAFIFRLKKNQFDHFIVNSHKALEETRVIIGQTVLDNVPLFKQFTAQQKKSLLDAMSSTNFQAGTAICRQGTIGNTFYIITDGSCRVTIDREGKRDNEVSRLFAGDFFGELALFDKFNRRSANVFAVTKVSCLCMSRPDFNRLLKHMKGKMIQVEYTRRMPTAPSNSNNSDNNNNSNGNSGGEQKVYSGNATLLSTKRRVSAYNNHGLRDEHRIASILRRYCAFLTQSLWNSLYHRMHRTLLLDPSKLEVYGERAKQALRSPSIASDTIAAALVPRSQTATLKASRRGSAHGLPWKRSERDDGVQAITEAAWRVLETEPSKRSQSDHAFVFGLLSQRSLLRDKLCLGWPEFEFQTICRKFRLVRVAASRKIFEVDARGSTGFLILRGAVRLFSKRLISSTASAMVFEEDLGPGEVFGEAALGGVSTRMVSAQALTNVDLAYIEHEDFASAKARTSSKMSMEEKYSLMMQMAAFNGWESIRLFRLAQFVEQKEVSKGVVLFRDGQPCQELMMVAKGRLDVILTPANPLVVTTIERLDVFGESSVLNCYYSKKSSNHNHNHNTSHNNNHSSNPRFSEVFYATAATALELLVLPEAYFDLLDMDSVESLKHSFTMRQQWRIQRAYDLQWERRMQERKTKKTVEALPRLLRAAEINKGSYNNNNNHSTNHNSDNLINERPKSASSIINATTQDMEDIPVTLNAGVNPLMVLPLCRFPKDFQDTRKMLHSVKVPKSARLRSANAKSREEKGFSQGRAEHSPGWRTRTQQQKRPDTAGATQPIISDAKSQMFPQSAVTERDFNNGNKRPVTAGPIYEPFQPDKDKGKEVVVQNVWTLESEPEAEIEAINTVKATATVTFSNSFKTYKDILPRPESLIMAESLSKQRGILAKKGVLPDSRLSYKK